MERQAIDTFTVTIKGQSGTYKIEADGPKGIRVEPQLFTWSPTPQQKATIAALANEKARVSSDAIMELGRALHDAVFIPPIATAFGRGQGSTGAERGLRLRLQIEPPELATLPWEAMHDGQSFLSARSDSPLVRTLPGLDDIRPIKRLQVRGALRILFVGASPQGLPALKIEETGTQLRELLKDAISKKRIIFDVLTDATLDELRSQQLRNYHILYFAGHGTSEGICLDDGMGGERDPGSGKRPAGDPYLVTAQTLAQELEGKPTRLVFLAACKTGASPDEASGPLAGFAQELARLANLPAIVAMQYPITDIQANQLTARFFESLAAFYPVDAALAEARKSLIRPGHPAGRDMVSPVMYLQAEDGALFRRARNWPVIGLIVALVIAMVLGLTALFWGQRSIQAEATKGAIVEMTKRAEETRRTAAETQEAIAKKTAQAEATKRAEAQAIAQTEAARRATEQAIAQTEVARRATQEAIAQTEAARRAQAQAQDKARQLAALAQTMLDNTRLARSVLLAIESLRRSPTLEGDQVLRHGLALLPRPAVARMEHEGEIYAMTFSPDGRWLATGSHYGARVWEAATGQEVARMEHGGAVYAVSFSLDGRWLVTGSGGPLVGQGKARVWEAATGREVAQIVHEDAVRAVAFSPDGRWVVSGGEDETAQVWEAATGQEVARMAHEGTVRVVAFSPDGRWVATASDDGTARVWEAATGQEMARMVHEDPVYGVVFSPDGRWLATGSDRVQVWEAATGQEVARMAHEGWVMAVAFSPDGRWLAAGIDSTVRVWEPATGREVAQMVHEWQVMAVAFSPDGRWLATGNGGTALSGGTARVWEAATGQEMTRIAHGSDVDAVAFSPDGRWLATGSGGTAQMWEAITGQEVARMRHEEPVDAVAFSPDGRWLATGSDGVRVWEAATGQEVARMAHEGQVNAVAFSPDGQWLATGGHDGAWVWEAVTGQEVAQMAHGWVEAVAFSPDGRWVATAGGLDETARVCEAATGQEVAQMVHEGEVLSSVFSVAFSPDGKWLATGSSDGTARVWEAASGREVARRAHTRARAVNAVAFSPDGRWLATGSSDGTARVWEAATGHEVVWMAHGGWVMAVAFSPDGRWLATGSDGARVWEAATGQEVIWMAREKQVGSVAFSPDGRWLATGSNDRTARVWLLWPEDLIAEACSRLTRNLTHEEWQYYIGNEPYRPTCPDLPVPGVTPTGTSRIVAGTEEPTLTIPTHTPTEPPTLTPAPMPTPKPVAVVQAEALNVRSGPGMEYDVVGQAKQGDGLEIMAQTKGGDWLQVRLADGKEGWISARLVEVSGEVTGVPVVAFIPPTLTPVSPTDTPTPIPPGMVYVPAGEFIMGSSDADVDSALALCNEYYGDCQRSWFEDEQPQHKVYLNAFYIDKTEVTNAQYQQCVREGVCQLPTTCDWGEPTYGDESRTGHPMVCVRWHDAKTYCEWAGARLPTEAEWEKAARGTDGWIYPWGNTFDGSKLNFCDANCSYDWRDETANDGYAKTAPVGSYPAGASTYGALDMAGNAWEWVVDWYDSGYYRQSPSRNPPGSDSGEERLIRGGSWYIASSGVRSADRHWCLPWHGNPDVGFRCARDAE